MHRSNVTACPCCGHPVIIGEKLDEVTKGLTPTERRMFEIVRRAGTAGIKRKELLDQLYEHDPNGGALNANIASVYKNYINRKIGTHGLRITTSGWGRGYWLETL